MGSHRSSDSIISKYPEWWRLREEAAEDPDNIVLWGQLVDSIEGIVASNTEDTKKSESLQRYIHSDFDNLLTRFPYLTQYWKRYVTLEYTLNGLEKSALLLKSAVESFPQCLELWVDYINITVSNKLKDSVAIKLLFEEAADKVGMQFLAHPFWDLYLGWEGKNSGIHSNNYLNIYLRVIRIPLHQYARYFEAFNEIRTGFTIKDLIPETSSDKLLTNAMEELHVGTTNWDEVDDDVATSLIPNYFEKVFIETQKGTNSHWEFESQVERVDFEPKPVSTQDLEVWSKYLTFEEAQGSIEQIISLYERCLIPACSYESIWIRYLRFLILKTDDKDKIIHLFNRACDTFVPKCFRDIRYMFARYYEVQLSDSESAMEAYYTIVIDNPAEYDPVGRAFRFLYRDSEDKQAAIKDGLSCVRLYIREHYGTNEGGTNRKRRKPADTSEPIIKSDHFKSLYKLLNFKTASQLIVEVAKIYWLDRHEVKLTRELLISFFKEELVRSSFPYWSFFFKFELCQRNKKNLSNIVNYVKYYGQLSTHDTNGLLASYTNFCLKNSTSKELVNNSREMIRNYLEIDPESSTPMKHFLKSRLDPDHNEDSVNKRLYRESGHPSGRTEGRPRIINPVDYTVKLNEMGPPPLPQFSSVEKANIAVDFIKEDM
ncbi:DEKNAAC105577 [Brettanomyces naardenensis]|uniref:DEKNAAC105577 n=1 Tax=Brettanomyces naardenensis TaxID=13370 RepID=A0A448YU13_BRENA|nr:DEKNAAC105577 [Brettanomyces naardenensis]